jgi:hypothetical protein
MPTYRTQGKRSLNFLSAAAIVALVGTFVLAWSFLGEVVTLGFEAERHPLWLGLGGGARMFPYGWGAAEALLVWRSLRREGHFDNAHRFLLWGVALLLVFVIYGIGLTSAFLYNGTSHPPEVIGLAAAFGLPAALAIWRSFYHAPRVVPMAAS